MTRALMIRLDAGLRADVVLEGVEPTSHGSRAIMKTPSSGDPRSRAAPARWRSDRVAGPVWAYAQQPSPTFARGVPQRQRLLGRLLAGGSGTTAWWPPFMAHEQFRQRLPLVRPPATKTSRASHPLGRLLQLVQRASDIKLSAVRVEHPERDPVDLVRVLGHLLVTATLTRPAPPRRSPSAARTQPRGPGRLACPPQQNTGVASRFKPPHQPRSRRDKTGRQGIPRMRWARWQRRQRLRHPDCPFLVTGLLRRVGTSRAPATAGSGGRRRAQDSARRTRRSCERSREASSDGRA